MLTYIVIGLVVVAGLILCFCLAVASFSAENYYEKLQQMDSIRNSSGFRTVDYVSEINRVYFGNKLRFTRCGEFQDHYSSGEVSLSQRTLMSNSLASLAIVSHELGHAKQDATGNKLKKHWKLRKAGKIIGIFFMPLLIIGIIFSLLYVFGVLSDMLYLVLGVTLLILAVLIFVFSIILKYKEIQIEKEASVFALEFLREILTEKEIKLINEFLTSARLTYWALLFRAMLGWTFLTKKDNMF